MVLVAKTNKLGSDEGQVTEPTVAQNDNAALKNARSFDPVEGDEFCDILRMPRLVHDGSNSASEETNHSAKNITIGYTAGCCTCTMLACEPEES